MRFAGLAAFPITPADPQGRIDTESLRRLLRRLIAARVDQIGLLGSTGTYAYLSRAERRRAIEAAAGETNGETPLLVGIGALRTDDAVANARDARSAGADALLLAPVSYTPLTDEEVFTHFRTVAAATDLPLCIYNNPGTTHFNFSPHLIARLSREAAIVAVKNPAPAAGEVRSQLQVLREQVAAGFSLGYSVDWHAAEALIAGGDGWYSVAAGLFPGPCLDLTRRAHSDDPASARASNARLQPLWELFIRHGSLRVITSAARLLGLTDHEAPLPILPLGDTARQEVERVLQILQLD